MSIKNILRKSQYLCFLYHRLLQIRKKFFVKLNAKKVGINAVFFDEFYYRKKTDTLFILGSGASINELTQEQWGFIKQHDSVGFNNWVVHKFVPDFYMFEAVADNEEASKVEIKHFFHNLNIRSEEYKDITIIYKLNGYQSVPIQHLSGFL